jgi:predicted DNA-binding transcriptional regulator AlpA
MKYVVLHLPGGCVSHWRNHSIDDAIDELAAALGISRRTMERERSAGRFPPPDLTIGRMPLWRPETIRRWVEGGGR